MDILWITGMPGCGKSTVSMALAADTGWRRLDTDEILAEQTGMPAGQLYREQGEDAFRRLEHQAVQAAFREAGETQGKTAIIALGGGSLIHPDTLRLVASNGLTLYLEADPGTLEARTLHAPRPSVRARKPGGHTGLAGLAELLSEREHAFRRCCDHILDARSGTPEHLAREIQDWLDNTRQGSRHDERLHEGNAGNSSIQL